MTTLTLARTGVDLGLGTALRNVARFFASIAAAQSAATDFERMNAKTDAQLSAQGLRRSDLSQVVFERHFV